MNNCGFDEDTAKQIESNYHELYKESDEWKEARLKQAAKDGYADVAFGLRVRTPILKQVIWGHEKMPYEASAEARTVGNAMGQSYGLLNNRAANEFMDRVYNSEHKLNIHPIAQIHDAQYYLIKKDTDVLKFINDNLIECMEWQELPEIQHDEVKLRAELELYYPDWSNPIPVPNRANREEIQKILESLD